MIKVGQQYILNEYDADVRVEIMGVTSTEVRYAHLASKSVIWTKDVCSFNNIYDLIPDPTSTTRQSLVGRLTNEKESTKIRIGREYNLCSCDTFLVQVTGVTDTLVFYVFEGYENDDPEQLCIDVFLNIYKLVEIEPDHTSTTREALESLCSKMEPSNEHPETPISPTSSGDPKARLGNKKMPFHHISPAALMNISPQTYTGAMKYGLKNWVNLDKEHHASVYTDATIRHLILFMAGQDRTSDSGQLHIDAIISGLTVYRDAIRLGTAVDDRVHYPDEYILDLEKELETWEFPTL